MVDSNNPLDQDFIDDISKAKSDVLGNALTQPKLFIIGRLNADGSVSTVVTDGEFGRVWVRQPGDDTGDAVEAINMGLEPHEVSRNRPVMVKKESGGLVITGKAIESANYDAQIPASPQRAINRDQYRVALITPSTPETSFYAYYRGGMFQLNNATYRVTDLPSSDFSGSVPGSNAISIKVELDPITGTWHETTGSAFTFSSMETAFKNGDLDSIHTIGRFLIGWIRLYAGQTAIELDDILSGQHMLDLVDRPKNNYTATTEPDENDDENDDYEVGSVWFNTVTELFYLCKDATSGAAVWHEDITAKITGIAESDQLVWDAVNNIWINVPILKDKKEPIGFAEGSRVKATLSFDNTTRTLTVSHISDYNIYDDSVMYPITGDLTRQISDDEGQHYIYYQNGALTSIYAPSAAERLDLFSILALTAIVYWDKTNQKINYLGEERHGTNLPGSVHKESHFTQGTWYYNNGGLGFSNFDIDGSGNDDSNVHFSVANGTVYDEDIEHNISNANQTLSPIAEMPIYYLDGTDWRRFWVDTAWQDAHVYSLGDQIRGDDSYFEVTTAGTSGGVEPTWAGNTEPGDPVVDNTVTWTCIGSPRANVRNFVGGNYRLAYNQLVGASWQQTEVSNGSFVLAHVVATNNQLDNQLMVVIQGQAQYSTIIAAREGATNEVNELKTTGLPFAEFVFIGTIIYQTSNGYGNEAKARIRTTDTGADYVDFRLSRISSGGATVLDHNVLGGLELAGTGVTYGHIDDQAQTIAGAKTFSGAIGISSGTITGITDLAVADGGTGRSSHTAYAVLTGGTTSAGAQQSIASVGTTGQVLTSLGAGALPTFQGAGGGNLELVEEKTFAGAAATTSTFSSLTGTDSYLLEARLVNDAVANCSYSSRINGDANDTDYFITYMNGGAAGADVGELVDNARIFFCFGSDECFFTANIGLSDGRLHISAQGSVWDAADTGIVANYSTFKNTAGVSSISAIEIIADQTDGIGIGSILRLYRRTT